MKDNYYRSGNDLIEIVLTDCTGRKLSKWKANASDAREVVKILDSLIKKYDLKIFIKYYGNLSKEKSETLEKSLTDFDWS